MYGLIIKFVCPEGKRDEFIRAMSWGYNNMNMDGCHSYILAEDPDDENKVWGTEIWESLEAHDRAIGGSCSPEMKAHIADMKARNLYTGRDMRVLTKPVAGWGLFKDGAWRPEPSSAADG